ncbi:hypothetical protein [Streptomyces hokutonensis]|uniref:Uncharacterized protein n=1 Tax=Streptomyces hokutonensis TaxID=1306990 RepID=A0ABW6MFK3_9ACTN
MTFTPHFISHPGIEFDTSPGTAALSVKAPVNEATTSPVRLWFQCTSIPSSISPSSGDDVGPAPADYTSDLHWKVDGYDIVPSLPHRKNAFAVRIEATKTLGAADLTWTIDGELRGFQSHGVVKIAHNKLKKAVFNSNRLNGTLRVDWNLSAVVPERVRDRLSLDLPIRLFYKPLLVGDFPVFLAVQLNISVTPEFPEAADVLHGHTSLSYSGDQGLSVEGQAIDQPKSASPRNVLLDPGIKNALRMPALDVGVKFPYISIGDDLFSLGASLWADFGVNATVSAGYNPRRCAAGDLSVDSEVGMTFQLFRIEADASKQVYNHAFPRVSSPRQPRCSSS